MSLERSRDYMNARRVAKELENVTKGLNRNLPAIPPTLTKEEFKQVSYLIKSKISIFLTQHFLQFSGRILAQVHNIRKVQSSAFGGYNFSHQTSHVRDWTVLARLNSSPSCVASSCPVPRSNGQTSHRKSSAYSQSEYLWVCRRLRASWRNSTNAKCTPLDIFLILATW